MTLEASSINFERAKITEEELATSVVHILDKHRHPRVEFPRIRRFAMELAIWIMRQQNRCFYFQGSGDGAGARA